jgi:hypothetical protein
MLYPVELRVRQIFPAGRARDALAGPKKVRNEEGKSKIGRRDPPSAQWRLASSLLPEYFLYGFNSATFPKNSRVELQPLVVGARGAALIKMLRDGY